ncbi:MAG: aminotransferase class I/II-fold pyridoxal phosphate-dependent enzyme [Spirochaetales bacterium]|nr:aminotransferase class I/II-fold pyridoxal phosphate-dependent enzyme [Spirochaetales bacterium]
MNELAKELNTILKGTVLEDLLSDMGRRFYFPKGIVAQSTEAAEHAHRFTATIGMAKYKGKPMNLESIRKFIPELDPDEIFPYAPTSGSKNLRLLWKKQMIKKNPHLEGIETSSPLVVAGITAGISILADLFTDPKDIIIIPDMFWGNYRLIFEGKKEGTVVTFPFFNEKNKLNLSALEKAMTDNAGKGKLILLLNFPNNPTGYAPLKDEVDPLASVLEKAAQKGLKILTIIDDSYYGLFYEEDIYPESIFTRLSTLHPNILAVKLDGATKEDFVWGFRIGFLTYGGKGLTRDHFTALEKKTMGLIRSSISNCNQLGQSLLIRGLTSETYESEKKENLRILLAKYEKVKEIIKQAGENTPLKALPFNSGYFMCFYLEKGNAEKLRHYLLYEKGIGTISIGEKYLRIAYACVELEQMEELFNEIYKAAEIFA